jgi:hypothetical protein
MGHGINTILTARSEALTAVLLQIWGSHSSVATDLRLSQQCCYRSEALTAVLLQIWGSHSSVATDLRL